MTRKGTDKFTKQKPTTWEKIKAGLVSAREKKRKLVKEVDWVRDFVGESGSDMASGLVGGSSKKPKRREQMPRNERYMPIRKKPPPKQNLPNGSAFLRSL